MPTDTRASCTSDIWPPDVIVTTGDPAIVPALIASDAIPVELLTARAEA